MTQQDQIIVLAISTVLGVIGNILWGLYVCLVPCSKCKQQKPLNYLKAFVLVVNEERER